MEETTKSSASTYSPSLSKREVRLLSTWERERRRSISRVELRALLGASTASDVTKSLVRKQVLQPLGRGVYLVRPLRTLLRPTTSAAPALAGLLLSGEPYYLGGLWAFTFHRLTTQQHGSLIDAFTAARHRTRTLGLARIVFHVLDREQLEWGVIETEIDGVQVRVSDLERTLLDALDQPRLTGGIDRSMALVTPALPRANRRRLVGYAIRASRLSTCQRLGVLLERSQTNPRLLGPLRKKVRETKSVLSMLTTAPRRGRLNPRWNVVENDR